MKDVLIGLVVGIVAVVSSQWFIARPRPVPEVRELSTTWGNASLVELGKPLMPSTQPDPVAQRLEASLESFEVRAKTLDESLAMLSERTGCNFFVLWPSLEAAGISRDDRISVSVKHATAAIALRQVLGALAPNVSVGYRVENGIVQVATRDALAQSTVVRVYDVRDLVQVHFDRQKQAQDNHSSPAWDDGQAGDALGKILEKGIDPTSWTSAGGARGDVQYFAGRLIINQTPENHDAINQLLAAMRRKQH